MLLIYEYIVNYLAINIELHTLQIHWLRHLYLLNIKIMIICIEKNIHFERLFIYFIFRIYKIPFHKKWASLSWVVDPILLTVFLLFTGYYYLWIWTQTIVNITSPMIKEDRVPMLYYVWDSSVDKLIRAWEIERKKHNHMS